MTSFGKKMAELRKEKKFSQTDLAKKLNTSVSVVSRYERDEMTPSVEVARKIASLLDTTVGYLLGETDQENLFKDPQMLKRFNEIENMQPRDREHILYTLDAMIRDVKTRKAYNS